MLLSCERGLLMRQAVQSSVGTASQKVKQQAGEQL
jgi:hypothetical protein